MTILGKIMAIFVFLLALAWFGLTAVVYSTRAEWKKAYSKALDEANKNAKDTEELKKQLLLERANIAARQQAADQAINALAKQRDDLDKKYADLLATANKASDASAALLPAQKNYDAAIKKVQDQVDKLTTETATLGTERDKYAKDAQLATNAKNDAELQRKVYSDALDSANERVRNLLEARQANAVGGAGADAKFRGEVTAITKDGLLGFSGGLNAGVKEGRVYKVTRNAAPSFLGYVKVSVVDTQNSAGIFTPVKNSAEYTPKKGDIITSE